MISCLSPTIPVYKIDEGTVFKEKSDAEMCRLPTYLFVSAYLVNETIVHANLFENVQTFPLLTLVTSDRDVLPAEKQPM